MRGGRPSSHVRTKSCSMIYENIHWSLHGRFLIIKVYVSIYKVHSFGGAYINAIFIFLAIFFGSEVRTKVYCNFMLSSCECNDRYRSGNACNRSEPSSFKYIRTGKSYRWSCVGTVQVGQIRVHYRMTHQPPFILLFVTRNYRYEPLSSGFHPSEGSYSELKPRMIHHDVYTVI